MDRKIRVKIDRYARWGPFAYWITATHGVVGLSGGWFAWTRAGAERKARRIAARMEREHRRDAQNPIQVIEP